MAFHTALNFKKLQVDICEHYREDGCMRGLHSCREGKDMAGENGNDAEFYKREITDIVNRINNTDVLNYIHIIVSDIGKEVGVNEQN